VERIGDAQYVSWSDRRIVGKVLSELVSADKSVSTFRVYRGHRMDGMAVSFIYRYCMSKVKEII